MSEPAHVALRSAMERCWTERKANSGPIPGSAESTRRVACPRQVGVVSACPRPERTTFWMDAGGLPGSAQENRC